MRFPSNFEQQHKCEEQSALQESTGPSAVTIIPANFTILTLIRGFAGTVSVATYMVQRFPKIEIHILQTLNLIYHKPETSENVLTCDADTTYT